MCEGFDLEIVPNKASEENKTAITIKGNEGEYLDAHRILKNFFRIRGQKYNINGIDIRVVDLPKNKLIKIEVKSKVGMSGKVNLNIYEVNNRGGATMMIQKVSGGTFDHVKIFGVRVMKFLIDGLIKGNIKEDCMEKFKIKIDEAAVVKELKKCYKCEKNFQTEQALKRHVTKVHTGETRFECESCENNFASKGELDSHMEKSHELTGSPECKKLRLNMKTSKEIEIQVSEKDFELETESKEAESEEMEIDNEEEYIKLSKLKDVKIIEKQKSIEKQE